MATNDIIVVSLLIGGTAFAAWFMWWYIHEKIKEEVPPEGRKWV